MPKDIVDSSQHDKTLEGIAFASDSKGESPPYPPTPDRNILDTPDERAVRRYELRLDAIKTMVILVDLQARHPHSPGLARMMKKVEEIIDLAL